MKKKTGFILMCMALCLQSFLVADGTFDVVTESVLPMMDQIYTVDLGKKVNRKQRGRIEYAIDHRSNKLRVMTYNMLYNMKGAEEKLPIHHRWENRKPRLLNYLSYANADIIGSQELQKGQVHEVMAVLDPDYGWYGEITRENEGRADVNAIFFKKERIELLHSETVPYKDDHYQNKFTVCHVRDKLTGKEFVVLNTKLTWGEPERRYAEAVQLNAFSRSFPKEMPVIVLGDFNTFPCLLHEQNMFLDGDVVEQVLAGDNLYDARRSSIFGHFGPLCSITNGKETLDPFVGPELTGFIK